MSSQQRRHRGGDGAALDYSMEHPCRLRGRRGRQDHRLVEIHAVNAPRNRQEEMMQSYTLTRRRILNPPRQNPRDEGVRPKIGKTYNPPRQKHPQDEDVLPKIQLSNHLAGLILRKEGGGGEQWRPMNWSKLLRKRKQQRKGALCRIAAGQLKQTEQIPYLLTRNSRSKVMQSPMQMQHPIYG